jgi:hypothetical protein
MAVIITPPGKGRIVPCPDCNGTPGRDSSNAVVRAATSGVPAHSAATPAGTTSTAQTTVTAWPAASAAATAGPLTTPAGVPKYCPARCCDSPSHPATPMSCFVSCRPLMPHADRPRHGPADLKRQLHVERARQGDIPRASHHLQHDRMLVWGLSRTALGLIRHLSAPSAELAVTGRSSRGCRGSRAKRLRG